MCLLKILQDHLPNFWHIYADYSVNTCIHILNEKVLRKINGFLIAIRNLWIVTYKFMIIPVKTFPTYNIRPFNIVTWITIKVLITYNYVICSYERWPSYKRNLYSLLKGYWTFQLSTHFYFFLNQDWMHLFMIGQIVTSPYDLII